jgi:hypothetical protein
MRRVHDEGPTWHSAHTERHLGSVRNTERVDGSPQNTHTGTFACPPSSILWSQDGVYRRFVTTER